MRGIIEFAVRRPVTTAMFYLGLALLGSISFSRLEVNLLPRMEFPRLTVVTVYPEASPAEVENLVTRPISEGVSSVSGIEKVFSESLEGVSFVTLQFSWGVNRDFAAMEVREKADLVKGMLPKEAGKPIVVKFDPNQAPIMELVFNSQNPAKAKKLRDFLEREVRVYLERVDGAGMVRFSGGYKKEVRIMVDQVRMASYGISLNDIRNVIKESNMNFPAGHIRSGSKDILIRTLGEYKNLEDVKNTIVKRDETGAPVRLMDLALVEEGFKDRTGLARYAGRECVVVSIYREAGKNTVQTAENLKEAVALINKKFARDVQVKIVYDESRFVKHSISNIIQSLLLGSALAFIALVLILRNFQSPMILLTALPVSILSTFIFLYFQGISLNIMSLGGLALGTGMLFDSGNVVLAAVERRLDGGESPKEAARQGSTEVAGSITTALITTIIVFLPIVFLKGVMGVVFAEMALTITFSLIVSLVVSLTLIPMLSSLRPPRKENSPERFKAMANFQDRLDEHYVNALNYFLDRPARLLFITAGLFLFAVLIFPFVQKEFIPRVDTGEFTINLQNPRGSSLKSTSESVKVVEQALASMKDVNHVLVRVGYDEEQLLSRKGGDVGFHQAQVRVVLSPDRKRTGKQAARDARKKIITREDIKLNFDVSGDILGKIISPESRSITLELVGEDLDTLADLGRSLKGTLARVPGVTDVKTTMENQAREYHVNFDPLRMAEYDLSTDYLARYLKTALKGDVVSHLQEGDEEVDIRLQVRSRDMASMEQLHGLSIKTPGGQNVYLGQVMHIKKDSGYSSILRKGAGRINRITANIQGASRNRVFDDVQKIVSGTKLPEGYKLNFSGEKEDIERSFRELGLSFLLAVVLIYLVLASKFESLKYPVVLLAAIPMIVIGVFPALFFTGKSLNVSSFMGMILLVGIVVDNGALLYEYIELLLEEGHELRDAVRGAGRIVLRPVMMNNSTTILGLLPVALELGEGTEFQSPMAVAVVAGLLTAVFLSLFIIPTVFFQILKRKEAVAHV